MARLRERVRVKEVLPHFDGRQLDYLIDFLTYVALPILLLWRAEILPARPECVALGAVAGRGLLVLPGRRQDRGRLLSGLSLVLEHCGFLPLRDTLPRNAASRLVDDRLAAGARVC